jgi:hypothetical protein
LHIQAHSLNTRRVIYPHNRAETEIRPGTDYDSVPINTLSKDDQEIRGMFSRERYQAILGLLSGSTSSQLSDNLNHKYIFTARKRRPKIFIPSIIREQQLFC